MIPAQILLLLVVFIGLGVALLGRVLEAVVVVVVSKFCILSNFPFVCSPAVWVLIVSLTTHYELDVAWSVALLTFTR